MAGVPRHPFPEVEGLLFDVFGTVVDWLGPVKAELERRAAKAGADPRLKNVDWELFARQWRAGYGVQTRAMSKRVVPDIMQYIDVDRIHRGLLNELVQSFGIAGAWTEAELQSINLIWHDLDGWPDSSHGLFELKKKYTLCTLSNGNTRLLSDLAKHSHLPWDVIISGDILRTTKPNPVAYLRTCAFLNLEVEQVAMVAAHAYDLRAAKALGMRTIYVRRPGEDDDEPEPAREGEFDVVVDGIEGGGLAELAALLGCGEVSGQWRRCTD